MVKGPYEKGPWEGNLLLVVAVELVHVKVVVVEPDLWQVVPVVLVYHLLVDLKFVHSQ